MVMTPSPPKDSSSHDNHKQEISSATKRKHMPLMSDVKVIDVLGGQTAQRLIDCPVPRMDTPSPSQLPAGQVNKLVMTTPTRVRSFAKGGGDGMSL